MTVIPTLAFGTPSPGITCKKPPPLSLFLVFCNCLSFRMAQYFKKAYTVLRLGTHALN
jgi:hypothetical protein